jgi:hypothetical protein
MSAATSSKISITIYGGYNEKDIIYITVNSWLIHYNTIIN